MSTKPYTFILLPEFKPMVEELLADPDPKGDRANARALLNMGEVMYQGSVAPFDELRIVQSQFPRPTLFARFPTNAMRMISTRGKV